jgi:hypothetical protein
MRYAPTHTHNWYGPALCYHPLQGPGWLSEPAGILRTRPSSLLIPSSVGRGSTVLTRCRLRPFLPLCPGPKPLALHHLTPSCNRLPLQHALPPATGGMDLKQHFCKLFGRCALHLVSARVPRTSRQTGARRKFSPPPYMQVHTLSA